MINWIVELKRFRATQHRFGKQTILLERTGVNILITTRNLTIWILINYLTEVSKPNLLKNIGCKYISLMNHNLWQIVVVESPGKTTMSDNIIQWGHIFFKRTCHSNKSMFLKSVFTHPFCFHGIDSKWNYRIISRRGCFLIWIRNFGRTVTFFDFFWLKSVF